MPILGAMRNVSSPIATATDDDAGGQREYLSAVPVQSIG